jgi:hypothetical protein
MRLEHDKQRPSKQRGISDRAEQIRYLQKKKKWVLLKALEAFYCRVNKRRGK